MMVLQDDRAVKGGTPVQRDRLKAESGRSSYIRRSGATRRHHVRVPTLKKTQAAALQFGAVTSSSRLDRV